MIERLRHWWTGWHANLLFFAQQEGHWLNLLLRGLRWLARPFVAVWYFLRLIVGLTRGIGPADEDTEE